MKTIRVSFLFTLFLMLSACASSLVNKPEDLKLNVPKTWVNENDAQGKVQAKWWEAYGGEQLAALVEQILLNNYDLRAAAARVQAAQANARIAGADLYPNLSAGLNASRRENKYVGLPIASNESKVLSSKSDAFGVSLDLSWELDLWGKLRAKKKAAFYEYEAAKDLYAGARLSLIGQSIKTYIALIEAQAEVRLLEEILTARQAQVDFVYTRYQVGLLDVSELKAARASLARTKSRLEIAYRIYENIQKQIEILTGKYPLGNFELKDLFPDSLEDIPAGLPAELVDRRPDLLAAKKTLLAKNEKIKEVNAMLFPQIKLSAGGGTLTNEFKNILDGDYTVWSLVANLAQPIFQGGRIVAGIDAAKAQSDAALAEYAAAVLEAFKEVESGMAAEKRYAWRQQYMEDELEEMQAIYSVRQKQYRGGTINRTKLLTAKIEKLERAIEFMIIKKERLENRINLHLALGGSFDK